MKTRNRPGTRPAKAKDTPGKRPGKAGAPQALPKNQLGKQTRKPGTRPAKAKDQLGQDPRKAETESGPRPGQAGLFSRSRRALEASVRGSKDAAQDKPPARDRRVPQGAERAPSMEAAPKKAPFPKTPVALSRVSDEPHPGQWILTTREGSEQDLVDELMLGKVVDPAPRVLGPGLVLSPKVPKREKRPVELSFARQGFEIVNSVRTHDFDQMIARLERSLRHKLERASQYALHVWVADTDAGNRLSSLAEELEMRLAERLAQQLPSAKRVDDASLRRLGSIPFAQVCLMDPERAVAGVMHSNATPSLARGGRTRVRVTGQFPSRAARKLEEALAWLGVDPSPGDRCVDLGAAPGGWTYVLAERRARVIAVDPALLRPEILAKKGVRHVKESAFTFTPDEPADWLFCDMAWRPLEAAALLAKWGRKRWARMLVANIKLPMKKKAELVARVRSILETEGEWKGLRVKQLYHDRDEVTLTAHTG